MASRVCLEPTAHVKVLGDLYSIPSTMTLSLDGLVATLKLIIVEVTSRVTDRVAVTAPALKDTVSLYEPGGRFTAVPLIDTVTVMLAPGAKLPLPAERLVQL